MDFSQVAAEFHKLKAQHDAGALAEADFKARLQELMLQDEHGRWWIIGYETGQWYVHDGEKWVRGEPPVAREKSVAESGVTVTRAKSSQQPETITAPSEPQAPSPWSWIAVGIVPLIVVVWAITQFVGRGQPAQTPTSVPPTLTAVLLTVTTAPTATPVPSTVTPAPPTATSRPPTATPRPLTITPAPTLGVGSTQISDKDGMVMVYVPAGEFLMGSADSDGDAQSREKPQHKVYLNAFWIDRTEVPNAMFEKFVMASGYKTDVEKAGKAWIYNTANKQWEEKLGADWQHPRGPGSNFRGEEQHPVALVSWSDAAAYCAWAGRRLPTEAEWEKAARGTDGRLFPWGAQDVAGDLLNFADSRLDINWAHKNVNDGWEFIAPVGSYLKGASPYGALDMAGNAWEWVGDWYDEKYYANSPLRNPVGPASGQNRVTRGGSWYNGRSDVRAAFRLGVYPEMGNGSIGFRCAGSPLVIEPMDNALDWKSFVIRQGVTVTVSSVSGQAGGGAVQVSFALNNDEWVGISKQFPLGILNGTKAIGFCYQGSGQPNTLEIKVRYAPSDKGAIFGVFLHRATDTNSQWICPEISYAQFVCWEGTGCNFGEPLDISKVQKVEFAISNKKGDAPGTGIVLLDDVRTIR